MNWTREELLEVEQGGPEWLSARVGMLTASRLADALCMLKKGGEAAARFNLKVAIAAERLTGRAAETYVSPDMLWGTENEPVARGAYEIRTGSEVDVVGLVLHPSISNFAASPDGLIDKNGGVEFKAPRTATHIDYMLAGMLPPEYEPQVMGNISCTQREWWDFVSFDPRLPNRHQLFIKRVYRNETRIKEIEDGARQFLSEVDELIANLEKLNPELSQTDRVFGKDRRYITDGITDADLPGWWRNAEA
jgi:hypothetical protein